jgi:uncharacterized protein with HEPN domain
MTIDVEKREVSTLRPLNDRHRIERILEMCRQIETYAYYGYYEDFYIDGVQVLAMMKRLEIIGDAAHWVSGDLREATPQIDWEGLAGLRQSLVDEYHEYNPKTIWREMTRRTPAVKGKLEKLLQTLPQTDEAPPLNSENA